MKYLLPNFIRYLFEYLIIKRSKLFQPNFYIQSYLNSHLQVPDAILHYIRHGWQEGNNPSPNFDTKFYLETNPDVDNLNINPFVHYIRWGRAEGRLPRKKSRYKRYPRYQLWINLYDRLNAKDKLIIKSKIKHFSVSTTFTIVLWVKEHNQQWVREAIESVKRQLYKNWELFIIIDTSNLNIHNRIEKWVHRDHKIKTISRNGEEDIIKLFNQIIASCKGDFIGVMTEKDTLSPQTLFHFAGVINQNSDAKIVYCDEDKLDSNNNRSDPYFKPEWNPDLLFSQNYLENLCVYHIGIVKQVGGYNSGFDDFFSWELLLRLTKVIKADHIHHIPFALFHKHIEFTLERDSENDNSVLNIHSKILINQFKLKNISGISRTNGDAKLSSIQYNPDIKPLVSVIIPTKNQHNFLSNCVESIINKTNYPNYEIIIVDNQSDEPETIHYLNSLKERNQFKIISFNQSFNYSAINNSASRHASGNVLLFLNNDTEVIDSNWLEEMVRHAIRPEIGAVGAMLYFPDTTIQHAGVVLGLYGVAGHIYFKQDVDHLGQRGRTAFVQNYSAVTAACMAIEKNKFNEVDGFDEINLPVAFNDIDLCIRLLSIGYRNLWTPNAKLFHHESLSRGKDDTEQKKIRFVKEKEYMINTWGDLLLNDPAYNPNLSLEHFDFSLAFPPRVIKPWLEKD